jgi:hypothetical protein
MSQSVKQEATLCKGGQELRRKIVPERAIPLGLGSKFPVEDTGYSARTEGEEREQRRVKNQDG